MKMLFHGHMLSNLCQIIKFYDFYYLSKLLEAYSLLEKKAILVTVIFLDEMFLNGL